MGGDLMPPSARARFVFCVLLDHALAGEATTCRPSGYLVACVPHFLFDPFRVVWGGSGSFTPGFASLYPGLPLFNPFGVLGVLLERPSTSLCSVAATLPNKPHLKRVFRPCACFYWAYG